MGIYFINLALTYIFNISSILIDKYKKPISKILRILAILIPSIIAGVRYNVGTDYANYVSWFNDCIYIQLTLKSKDIGFSILIKLIQIFTYNPQIMFFICSLIINTLIYFFILKNTKKHAIGYFLFFALYFYYSSLNITRQWIAIAICLYSLKFAFDNKKIKYILGIMLAACFHKTAIILIPLVFISKIKLNAKNTSIFITVLLIFFLFFETIVKKVSSYINLSDYLKYFESMNSIPNKGGYAYFIMGLFTLVLILFFIKKYREENKNADQQIWILLAAVVFALYGTRNFIFDRLQLYFVPIYLICIPNLINIMKNRRQKIILEFIIMTLGTLYMYRCLLNNGGDVVPYNYIIRK